jgi:hypothetical protein
VWIFLFEHERDDAARERPDTPTAENANQFITVKKEMPEGRRSSSRGGLSLRLDLNRGIEMSIRSHPCHGFSIQGLVLILRRHIQRNLLEE